MMLTAKDICERDNIFGKQITGTPYFRLTLITPAGEETDLGAMTVTPKQMFALSRTPSDHKAILATSERMPVHGR